MIRYAIMADKDQGLKLLKEHIKEFEFAKDFKDDCSEYYDVLLTNLIKEKTIIVSENDGIIDGCLIGAKSPNTLNPYKSQLHMIVTWVHPDKRGSSIFYRMNALLDKDFKNMDKIYSCMPGITNVNHERLGYKRISINYIKKGN